ncbi:LURP-one-related - like 8 [Theobroma cacao]|nr:LURP-one-related - like 8 [Theobroma cacao]
MSSHDKWQAFRGDSTESSDLIFPVKQSSMFQLKTKLDVFLANNTKEDVCDFKIKGSWSERCCVVYAGESSTIVAQDKFMVTVHPNIDYAFIVALIVVLDGIKTQKGHSTAIDFGINIDL